MKKKEAVYLNDPLDKNDNQVIKKFANQFYKGKKRTRQKFQNRAGLQKKILVHFTTDNNLITGATLCEIYKVPLMVHFHGLIISINRHLKENNLPYCISHFPKRIWGSDVFRNKYKIFKIAA